VRWSPHPDDHGLPHHVAQCLLVLQWAGVARDPICDRVVLHARTVRPTEADTVERRAAPGHRTPRRHTEPRLERAATAAAVASEGRPSPIAGSERLGRSMQQQFELKPHSRGPVPAYLTAAPDGRDPGSNHDDDGDAAARQGDRWAGSVRAAGPGRPEPVGAFASPLMRATLARRLVRTYGRLLVEMTRRTRDHRCLCPASS
jgi:hypothetical protein